MITKGISRWSKVPWVSQKSVKDEKDDAGRTIKVVVGGQETAAAGPVSAMPG